MGELVNRGESAIVPEVLQAGSSILNAARDKAYTAVNFAMVEAYWEIGKSIVDEQGGEERAKYGEALLKALAIRLTKDFGKGFEARELRKMRQFYLAFPIRDSLRPELSWTHYRRLIRIPDPEARTWYMNECARFSLEHASARARSTPCSHERLLASKDKGGRHQKSKRSARLVAPRISSVTRHVLVFRFLGRYCVSRER